MKVKMILYSIVVICYFVAGGMDLFAKEWRPGILAILYGLANIVIFLFR